MKLYWVSAIIQDKHDKRAWRCSLTDGCLSMEEAFHALNVMKSQHTVLFAWIDETDDRGMRMLFNECYVDTLGNVRPGL